MMGRQMPHAGWQSVAVDAALITIFALHHSLFARERVKEWLARRMPGAPLRSTYVWVASLLLMLVCQLWRRIGDLVTAQLGHVGDAPDSLPSGLRTRRGLPLRRDALLAAHRPDTLDQARTAEQRLAFEELFLLQAGLISHRRALERTTIARALGRPGEMIDSFRASLPFTPTAAQDRAMVEIDGDLDRSVPMQRLLQGDVGSGKTLVAVHALLRAVERDGQGR